MRNLVTGRRGTIVVGLWVLIIGAVQPTMATPDSNSIIVDSIEYYFQTDKSVYTLGENVEMLYRVTNLREEGEDSVTFTFPHSPEYQFWVEQDEEQIWKAIQWRADIPTAFTLLPGEYRVFPFSSPFNWNMRDNGNNLVDLGRYKVIGGLYNGLGTYDYTKVAVSIDIIPEPSTLILFGVGFAQIIRKKC